VTFPAWQPVYVGLGSNLDDPATQIERALASLERLAESRLVLRSAPYQTPPVGPIAQPDFVNVVAGMLTQRAPAEFLAALKSLEKALGRAPSAERWGPRRIDLDLLVYGRSRIAEPGLEIPHPALAERAFVLLPLADIAPDLDVPGRGHVRDLLARIDTTGIRRLPS
jgi:2-amino-4-hydroxy-6-hydroxymethyldihydropteridine diphosphokinase